MGGGWPQGNSSYEGTRGPMDVWWVAFCGQMVWLGEHTSTAPLPLTVPTLLGPKVELYP